MPTTLFLEAFGQLSDSPTIESKEEDLHSVFRERAELMRWATTSSDRPLLWSMEEAEITADTEPHRIGWVQVGLGIGPIEVLGTPANPGPGWAGLPTRQRSTDPVLALSPLVQCFSDALSRFGVVELSGPPGDGKFHRCRRTVLYGIPCVRAQLVQYGLEGRGQGDSRIRPRFARRQQSFGVGRHITAQEHPSIRVQHIRPCV